MNKALRQLFTAVIVLFVILGLSSTTIMAVRANALNEDPRNTRALYVEYGAPRGAILASDGTILAHSDPISDSYQYQRKYAAGPIYAPITGYYSITNRADRGIESSRNQLLSGQADSLWLDKIKTLFTGAQNKGASIETSIDPKIQQAAYQALAGQSGSVVAIEPSTGRVLAMVSTPSYDPNTLAVHDASEAAQFFTNLANQDANPMLNRASSQLYPPGSTFKVVVAAAALESGKYKADSRVPAGAAYTLPGTATNLTNATAAGNGSGGEITLQDALAYSSNTAFAQLGVSLGGQALDEEAKKFGFGSTITLDGTDSTGRPMRATASKFPADASPDKLAQASIGQGNTLTTPLQNAMVAAAVANGGKLMQPTLVDRVRSSDLSVLSETSPAIYSQPFSPDTAQALTAMMEAVVTKDSPNLQIPGAQVAAKTGTAQIGVANSSNDGWTIGFAPAQKPKIAVAVVVHSTSTYGAASAGPIMKRVMQEGLK
ncbi:penicillin binding protein transpeptidase domain protein [Bifidobacterium actinocoloniiforme DSM 22766]|uniref:Penicillin binding protein transpeptidase domain protein n=1 Tax=Bifidobacterium actinocoloniiforme DSM 22766 TaxID=1437605 RepID=A0A086YWE2_9BIFI|nr:penicillin-binding protein 2 [Bifidobacterium actinocoloniiforme]AKV55791.1 penicillin-binding protein [Bifidobacterium actinocoloniiforme DSM 22766]KFI38592.1 penicillin binding protein transpeptidase domain protein [Bifidobacterium actinocoloniiforme DSM 22766]